MDEPTIEEIPSIGIEGDGVAAVDAVAAVASGAQARRFPSLPGLGLGGIAGGIAAVGVKELRGRMRGRRAFVILTIYLLLLGGFAWMVEVLLERTISSGFGSSAAFASATIGQGIFAALMFLETLQVVFLAPASTAGAISLEREKQTLDMLVATPISSVAIVVGKLLSALIYVFLLIAASVPLTAVVFVFGGVGPEDVLRGYLVLLVTALGLGAFGLFCSSLVRRTQAATAITVFGVLAISIGSLFLLVFWAGVAGRAGGAGLGPVHGRPPEVVAYVNPFIAQADVLCTSQAASGAWCAITDALVPDPNGIIVTNGPTTGGGVAVPAGGAGGVIVDGPGQVAGDVAVAPDVVPFGARGDALWPKSVATWLILTVVFVGLSIQLVSPSRRWRPRRLRRPPRSTGEAAV